MEDRRMPNRIIKESICTSEDLDKLSPMAEILFYRLIVKADDYGAYYGNVAIVKSNCFPLKSDDITCDQVSEWMQELVSAGLIDTYKADGRDYIQLHKWKNHQQIRAKKRKFPEPAIIGNQMISDDSKCPRNPIQSNTNPNTNPTRTRAREDEQDDGFTAFWNAYPRKSGDIRQAYMAYLHALDTGATPEKLIEAINAQTDGVSPEDLHFLPSAEKWLRNRGWESKASLKSTKKETKPKQYTTAQEYKAPQKAKSVEEIMELVDKI